jgi:large subunit ribosomal protein L15
LQRRLPKFGFTAFKSSALLKVLRIDALNKLDADVIDIHTLKDNRLIPSLTKEVKLIATGKLEKPVTVKGLKLSKGAEALIKAAGGRVEA